MGAMNESTTEKGKDATIKLTTIGDLLGKKSVRATFKLHPTTIELLSSLAAQLGIKQKSLFDYLMEDEDALQAIAASLSLDTDTKEQRIQKTFVISQRSLAALNSASKYSPASRDDLIERSIQRLLPVLEKERFRQLRREEALVRISKHCKQGKELLADVKKTLGEDDTLYQSLVSVIETYGKTLADIQKLVKKGKRISKFPVDSVKGERHER